MTENEFSARLEERTLFDEELRRKFEARINFCCAIVVPLVAGITSYNRDLPKSMELAARLLSRELSFLLLSTPLLFTGIAAFLATLAVSTAAGNQLIMSRMGYWCVEQPYRERYNKQLVNFASPIVYEKSIVAGFCAVIFQQFLSHLFKSREISAIGAGISVGLVSWFGFEKPAVEIITNTLYYLRRG